MLRGVALGGNSRQQEMPMSDMPSSASVSQQDSPSVGPNTVGRL